MFTLRCLFVLVSFIVSTLSNESCHSGRSSQLKTCSTKTPYAFLAEEYSKVIPVSSPGCEPVQFWMLSRHGTRYPSPQGIQLILERLPQIVRDVVLNADKSQLCEETINLLKEWEPTGLKVELKKKLHPEGELEMTLLAERFQKRFPDLLNDDYHEEHFTFKATGAERAERSAFYFATGLFGRQTAVSDIQFDPPVMPHDPLIRPYKVCSKWQKEVKKNPESLLEKTLFETSDEFKTNVVKSVSQRFGYEKDLDLEDIDAIYNGCVFGQAWDPKQVSPWCQTFSDDELSMLEYREDLEYYWQDGYGFDISGQLACVFVKNVLENFANITRGVPNEEKGIFYFSHSGSVLKLLTFLGLFRDAEHIKHDNYAKMRLGRQWRTSFFDAFGSNVAFALQKCDDTTFQVGLFVNEQLTVLPGCDKVWCDLEKFEDIFQSSITKCELKDICAVNDIDKDYLTNVDDDRF